MSMVWYWVLSRLSDLSNYSLLHRSGTSQPVLARLRHSLSRHKRWLTDKLRFSRRAASYRASKDAEDIISGDPVFMIERYKFEPLASRTSSPRRKSTSPKFGLSPLLKSINEKRTSLKRNSSNAQPKYLAEKYEVPHDEKTSEEAWNETTNKSRLLMQLIGLVNMNAKSDLGKASIRVLYD